MKLSLNRFHARKGWSLLALLAGVVGASADPGKPNVLFIIADDQTYAAVRAFGMTDIETPSLDRLVVSGHDIHARLQHGFVERCGVCRQSHHADDGSQLVGRG